MFLTSIMCNFFSLLDGRAVKQALAAQSVSDAAYLVEARKPGTRCILYQADSLLLFRQIEPDSPV